MSNEILNMYVDDIITIGQWSHLSGFRILYSTSYILTLRFERLLAGCISFTVIASQLKSLKMMYVYFSFLKIDVERFFLNFPLPICTNPLV